MFPLNDLASFTVTIHLLRFVAKLDISDMRFTWPKNMNSMICKCRVHKRRGSYKYLKYHMFASHWKSYSAMRLTVATQQTFTFDKYV